MLTVMLRKYSPHKAHCVHLDHPLILIGRWCLPMGYGYFFMNAFSERLIRVYSSRKQPHHYVSLSDLLFYYQASDRLCI